MQGLHKYKPSDGVNLDVADKYLAPTESRYILNADEASMTGKDNVTTPLNSNKAVPILQPQGTNTTIGKHYSKRTQELYCFIHNSLSNHHIYRVNANGTTEMVLMDPDLGFTLDPANQVNMRSHLFFNNNNFVSRGNKVAYKYLLWTNGTSWQGFLDVETSIATNGFRTPYYRTTDRKIYWQLPPRPSLRCPELAWLTNTPADLEKNNSMLYTTWQFRVKFIFTDGRESAWGPISESIFHQKSACESEENYQRCVKLTIDAGSPLVEKYVLSYRNCAGNFTTSQNPDWYICDYIERYATCLDTNTPFYERTINDTLNYNSVTNTFDYVYCGDKLCIPIDRQETDRNYNDIPITSFALFPLDERLALGNNTFNYQPINCAELDKIKFNVVTDPNSVCKIEMTTIKVAIIIHNVFWGSHGLNQPIYYYENDDLPDTHTNLYGGLSGNSLAIVQPYKQSFQEKKGNFIVYVEGTPYMAKSRQWKTQPGGFLIKEEYPKNVKDNSVRSDLGFALSDNKYYYTSIAEITVPKGTKGFLRIASPQATSTSDYQSTSANVLGVLNNRAAYSATTEVVSANSDRSMKELYFDASGGSVDLTNTPFIICDLSIPPDNAPDVFGNINNLGANWGVAFSGYLTAEQRAQDGTVLSSTPIERASVEGDSAYPNDVGVVTSLVTDHNGYYFATFRASPADIHTYGFRSVVNLFGEVNCQRANLAITEDAAQYAGVIEKHLPVTGDYYKSNFERVFIRILDTNNNPISGIRVVVEGGKAKATAFDGFATLIVRNAAGKTLRFIPMQSGVCPLILEGCNFSVPVISLPMPACLSGGTITYNDFPRFQPNQVMKGLMPGGTYPLAVKFIDDAGRESNAQGNWTVDMPQILTVGNFLFSHIAYDIDPLTLPKWVAKMAILIGKNRNQEDAISWAVDEVIFVDGAGNPTSSFAAEKVKLSIKSLYDQQRKLSNSNVKYQFVRGDRVKFLVNADGSLFSTLVDAYIESDENNRDTYLTQSTATDPVDMYSFLTVSFVKEMENLAPGAVIQIYTPRVCQNEDYYYETCQLIDVRGVFPINGTVNSYDTYQVRRNIGYNNIAHFFSYPFLHHSPSDFWGDHCISRGRVSVKNPYEKQVKLGRNVAVSLPFFTNANFNGLGTFISQYQKNFTGEQRGDMVAAVSIEQRIMFILEHDNFIAAAADDFVHVDNENRLRANAGEMSITDANSKTSGNYGCAYDDVGSVVAGDGWVFWMDSMNAAPIIHDWSIAKNIAEFKMESYFNRKLVGKTGFVAGHDPVTNRIYLTIIKQEKSFVHNSHEVQYEKNETLAITISAVKDPTLHTLLRAHTFRFVSFTPENYGYHLNYLGEMVMISFMNGAPYVHMRYDGSPFNEFFGVSCDQVLDFIINTNPDKVKLPVAMQVQSSMSYYAEIINTSQGQQSMIVPSRSKKITERKHDMEFLCDVHSRGGLYNGSPLRGYTIRVRMVRDNTQGVLINTIDQQKQQSYNELDAIIVKFSMSEQSGYKNS